MHPSDMDILINKYISGHASADEIRTVDQWYADFDEKDAWSKQLSSEEIELAKQESIRKLKNKLD